MASNLKFSAALKNAQQNAISTTLGASAIIDIYDGAQPASPDVAITTQVLLASLTCNATFAAAAANGVLTANAISNGTGTAAATVSGKRATWYRMRSTVPAAHVDGTCGTNGTINSTGAASAGETYDLNINNNLITTGQTVSVTSMTFTNGQ